MRAKIMSTIIAIAMISFAFNAKASTVTIYPGISYIAFYPTQGGDPFVLYSSGDLPDGSYTAVAQIAGSLALTGYVIHSYDAFSGYDPMTWQPIYQNYSTNWYPDNDPYSSTFGQTTIYSIIVDSTSNNTFHMGYM